MSMMDRDQQPGSEDTRESKDTASSQEQQLESGDFYYEGPYLVFTEAYHLKRGYCCNSGCRHCPYR
jgi:Family of unknown function (DUF5522)